jgi:hypothetical protein
MTSSLTHALQRYLVHRPATSDDHVWYYRDRLLSDEALLDQVTCWGKHCDVKVTLLP